ncbi:hypothetical protein ACUOA8_39415, partial [Escherichia sp. SS-MK2]
MLVTVAPVTAATSCAQMVNFDREQMRRIANNMPE